jgi:superfamily II DNA/RNA helicase
MSRFKGRNNFSGNSFNGNKSRFSHYGKSSRGKKTQGENIDVSRFIKKSDIEITKKEVTIKHLFSDFKLADQLKRNLIARNYTTPTPIQDQSIEYIIDGRDLIGLANTGTGKTAAFLLPMINKCYNSRNQKVLIVAPTRELAIQINDEFRKFTASLNIYSAICVGGAPIYRQISDLRRNPNFVIGTPGRLKDLKNRGVLRFGAFQNVVLDEIDRMLDMGFVEEIKQMLMDMPMNRQSLFFSATIPPKIKDLANQFLNNPITVSASCGDASHNIDQDVVRVSKFAKFDKLKDLLISNELKKVLIFSETKRDVEKLTENLREYGFKADSIHGDKRQSQRQNALAKFKENHVQILVATDVAARGLDINNVTHVINYTLPHTYNDYIHRIGRTGRGDKKGFALTFVEAN